MTRAPLFIVNPLAGSGRSARLLPRIRDWLSLHGVSHALQLTRERGHAEKIAGAAAAQGHDRVVAVGGDGTIQEVLNGLLVPGNSAGIPALGVVPAGRGNDVVRGLGLPSDPLACLPIALGDATRLFDVAIARDSNGRERCFAAAGGAGFDAQVAHTMHTRRRFWMRGEAGYILATVNELRRYRNHALTVTLCGENGERIVSGKFLFVAFANGPYYGGGMRICPEARTDDGLLDVCLVGDLSRFAALKELPGIYKAMHVKHPRVEIVRVRSMRIDGDPETLVHLDGEPFGAVPMEIRMQPGALRVACSIIGTH